jgi:hypothetical protein
MKNWIFKEESSAPPNPKVARTRAMLLSAPFALLGFFALVLLVHDGLLGGLTRQKAMGLLSAVVVCTGFPFLIFGITAKKQALKAAASKASDDGKSWLKREDWAKGRIASGSKKSVFFLWLFTVVWNLISAPVVFISLPDELHKGNYLVLMALLFPIIGIGMILFALNTTLAWRRFGQSIFEMAAIPGALGGTLEGLIQVNTRLRPEHGIQLRLSCVRTIVSGSGKDRSTSEKILWQDEKILRADFLPETEPAHTGIPIYFKLPADQPESDAASKGGFVHWRLEASARLRGPNFHATFDVPVFKLEETPAVAEDLTAPYQIPLEEIRRQIHSRVQTNDLPGGGREFVFPAVRNPGFAAATTVFVVIWTGAILVFAHVHAAPIFLLVFGGVDLLMLIFSFDLWFRRSRVVATPEQVTIQTSWLGVTRKRAVAVADISGFTTPVGATAGHHAYHDLRIKTRAGREITAASNLGSKVEADWLVQQMAAVLKRSA